MRWRKKIESLSTYKHDLPSETYRSLHIEQAFAWPGRSILQ